jgi:hypothetical protein
MTRMPADLPEEVGARRSPRAPRLTATQELEAITVLCGAAALTIVVSSDEQSAAARD